MWTWAIIVFAYISLGIAIFHSLGLQNIFYMDDVDSKCHTWHLSLCTVNCIHHFVYIPHFCNLINRFPADCFHSSIPLFSFSLQIMSYRKKYLSQRCTSTISEECTKMIARMNKQQTGYWFRPLHQVNILFLNQSTMFVGPFIISSMYI